jgi:hypothetical protein
LWNGSGSLSKPDARRESVGGAWRTAPPHQSGQSDSRTHYNRFTIIGDAIKTSSHANDSADGIKYAACAAGDATVLVSIRLIAGNSRCGKFQQAPISSSELRMGSQDWAQ